MLLPKKKNEMNAIAPPETQGQHLVSEIFNEKVSE